MKHERCDCAECRKLDTLPLQGIPGTFQLRLFKGRRRRRARPESSALTLNLNGIYFDAIARGEKVEEYRLANAYWRKRLARSYETIVLLRGYPKGGGILGETRIELPWRGFEVKTLEHPHFGPNPVEVFALKLAEPADEQIQLWGE